MPDNNEQTPPEETPFLLNRQADQVLGNDPIGVAAAIESLKRTNIQEPLSASQLQSYKDFVARRGVQKADSSFLVDRSRPIGRGEGTRQVVTPQDIKQTRIVGLDRGMADQDEAYSPTFDLSSAKYFSTEYINYAIKQTQSIDPELAAQLAFGERYLAMYPEMAVATRSGFGFAGIVEQLVSDIVDVSDLANVAGAKVIQTNELDNFYSYFGNQIDPETKQIISISLAPLSLREQIRMAGLGAAYIDASPLVTNEDQIRFAAFFAGEAESIYARESDQSFWGKFGRVGANVFTNPANFLQDKGFGSLWNLAVDPADAWYRNVLTLEETMAISIGLQPGTTAWATYTGLTGAAIDIVVDPTNILLIGLSGFKAAKTAAMIDDFVNLSRFERAVKVGLPFGGKARAVAAGLPKGVRGRSARIAWAIFGRDQNAILELAEKKGVFKTILEADSYAEITEKIPALKNAEPNLVELMLSQTTEKDVKGIYSAAYKGDYLDPHSPINTLANKEVEEAKKAINDIMSNPETLTAGDVIVSKGGRTLNSRIPISLSTTETAEGVVKTGNIHSIATPETKVVYFLNKGTTNSVTASEGSVKLAEIKNWVAKNTKYKNSGITDAGTIRIDAMRSWMKANDIDAVRIGNDVIVNQTQGLIDSGKLVKVIGGDAKHLGLADAIVRSKRATTQLRVNSAKADSNAKWIISDMPIKVRSSLDDYKFWKSQYGVFAGSKYSESNFLVRKFRGIIAKTFVDDVPARIATGYANRKDGVNDLRRLLVQMGVDPDFVRKSINEYMAEPTRGVVQRILRDAGADIGDPEMALGIMRFQDKSFSQLEYAVINGKEQLTVGKDISGVERLQPLISSQTVDYVQLQEPRAFSAHLRRIKRASNRHFGIRNRGFGKTKANRKALIEGFGEQLKGDATASAAWEKMDLNDKFAVAYSVVRPRDPLGKGGLGDGLGYAAKIGQTLGEANARLRNTFSIAMLAWRPIGWQGNEMLDNTWRGVMAGSMSFFRHPFQSMGAAIDTSRIERGLRERALFLSLAEEVLVVASKVDTPAAMIEEAARIVPDIKRYVNLAETREEQLKALRKFLNVEIITQTDAIAVLDDPLARALYRQRKGQAAATKYNIPANQAGDLYDPDWGEASLSGWETLFADNISSASMRHEWTPGQFRPPETLRGYAAAWQASLVRDVKDPAIRMYLSQYADIAAGGTDAKAAARAYINSQAHARMREPIANMLRGVGLNPDDMTDAAQVEWYFAQKIKPYVEDQFGLLLTEANARSLSRGQGFVTVNGQKLMIDLDRNDSILKLALAANGTDARLPESVVGLVNPRTLFGQEGAKGWKTPLRSYNNWALQKFGHDIPAKIQRRPAFIRAVARYSRQYEALGMTPEAAQIVAKQKSMQLINTSFFFLDAQTPFLKSMNRIIPFYAAQWEVIKAWIWKVPTLANYAGIGHARMLRSFDHVFNALRRNGLLQPRYNREGKVDGWDMQFASSPQTDNAAGSLISRGGYLALMAPSVLIEQIAEIVTGNDLDLVGSEINFNFNHPYDFFSRRGGVMPTARMQLGINPAYGYPTSKIRQQLPFTSSSEQVTTLEVENLAVFLEDNEIKDAGKFLVANGPALIAAGALTEDELKRANAGTFGITNIEIPAGVNLFIPGTTLIARLVDSVLFPYGQVESISESTSGFIPSVIQNIFKSIALYQNNGDVDGLSSWNVPWIMGPTGRWGGGMGYADAAANLEMRTGVFSRQAEIALKLSNTKEGTPEAFALETELKDMDDFITSEVRDAAATSAFIQTIYGVILPFNPRRPSEAQTLRSYYFAGRTAAEQWSEGNPVATPFDGNSVADTFKLIAAWASDDTGSAAKVEFLEQNGGRSSILAAITPISFWGLAGKPAQATSAEEYFRNVETGARKAMPLDVWSYRFNALAIQVEKDLLIIEEYGNNPEQQALAILGNSYTYNLLTEEMDNRYRALDLQDELMNNGAYAAWKERNGTASYLDFVADEQAQLIEAITITIDEVDLDIFPENPAEAKDLTGKLKGIRNALFSLRELYDNEKYADYGISKRQEILNNYYDRLGTYFDELSVMYESIDTANNDDEVSNIYSSIARYRNLKGIQGIRIGTVSYPAPEEYTWNSKSPEKQKAIIDSKLAGKLEWLSSLDVERYVKVYPAASDFLPVSAGARAIIDWKLSQDAAISRGISVEGQYFGMSAGDVRQQVREEFEKKLAEAGEIGVLESINNYPMENAQRYGSLPLQLQSLVPKAIAIHRQLTSLDKSPLTKAGKEAQRWMYFYVLEQFAANPSMRDVFVTWGTRTFQETNIESIVAKMLGNYTGDIG